MLYNGSTAHNVELKVVVHLTASDSVTSVQHPLIVLDFVNFVGFAGWCMVLGLMELGMLDVDTSKHVDIVILN